MASNSAQISHCACIEFTFGYMALQENVKKYLRPKGVFLALEHLTVNKEKIYHSRIAKVDK